MQWANGHTSTLAMYLKTRTGISWCAKFFYQAHLETKAGTYQEDKWKPLFRDGIVKGLPSFFDGKKVLGKPNLDVNKIDWDQLYSYYFEFTKHPKE